MPLLDNYIPAPGASYSGGIAEQINDRNFTSLRRPYLDRNDRPAVTIFRGRYTVNKGVREQLREHTPVADLRRYGISSMVANATALRKEEWLQLDQVVLRAARYRLRAWSDLAAANSFGGFNAMSKMVLEHETMSDPGEAMMDLDGLTEGRTDAPQFQLQGLPLPITHSDFWVSSRKLAISRNTGTPLDTTMGEAAGRRVAEMIEKTTIGVTTGITYGGNSTQVGGYGRASTVYGYTNYTPRLTKTNLTAPSTTNQASTLADVLAMRQSLTANKFYGPFMLYHTPLWDQYMDGDYQVFTVGANNYGGSKTLRERLRAIEGIQDVKRLDMFFDTAPSSSTGPGGESLGSLKSYSMILVQMTQDVCRAVNGMDITTVQWESVGGMRLNFKVMCIQVPQLRCDHYGNVGILHATTS